MCVNREEELFVTVKSRDLSTNRQRWTRSRDSGFPSLSVVSVPSFSRVSLSLLHRQAGKPAGRSTILLLLHTSLYCTLFLSLNRIRSRWLFECVLGACARGRRLRTIARATSHVSSAPIILLFQRREFKRESLRKKIYTGINARIFTIRPKVASEKRYFWYSMSRLDLNICIHIRYLYLSNSSRQLGKLKI